MGSSLSTMMNSRLKTVFSLFSSPQWGSFLSTVLGRYASGQSKPSFRPLNGVLFYLQVALTTIDNPFDPFSSPQRGSFLSTSSLETPKKAWDGFRPLNGVLFYLRVMKRLFAYCDGRVFVPSTGFFSIYHARTVQH